jgi:hypothetical protein
MNDPVDIGNCLFEVLVTGTSLLEICLLGSGSE